MHFIHIEIPSISVVYSVCFSSVLSFLCVTAPKHIFKLGKEIVSDWLKDFK